jgi:hypothetical protein
VFIQKGNLRAPLRRVVKARMHKADWRVMEETIAQVKQMRLPKGKTKGTS